MEQLVEILGEPGASLIAGAAIGMIFGGLAQASRFCLRAATIEFWRGRLDGKVAVWSLAFATAVVATQLAVGAGLLDTGSIRALGARGSLSGAVIGGALFGAGMVLTRGCASRLLVLSATGNLRALLAGLVFAVVAQASLRGALGPVREHLAGLWSVSDPGQLDLLAWTGLGPAAGLGLGVLWLFGAVALAKMRGIGWRGGLVAAGVGGAVALAWVATSLLARSSFDPQPVRSLSFTGPSANVLMAFLVTPSVRPDFDIGLVPGVFAGSFLVAALRGELKLVGFEGGVGMPRYLVGAVLMGFGGMLAGGCAIGAGVSGAAVFSSVAWVTLFAMWAAAGLTDMVVDRARTSPQSELDASAPPPQLAAVNR